MCAPVQVKSWVEFADLVAGCGCSRVGCAVSLLRLRYRKKNAGGEAEVEIDGSLPTEVPTSLPEHLSKSVLLAPEQ